MRIELKHRKQAASKTYSVHIFPKKRSVKSFADDLFINAISEEKKLSKLITGARKSGVSERHFSIDATSASMYIIEGSAKSPEEKEDLRMLGAKLTTFLNGQKIKEVQIINHTGISAVALCIAEGAALAGYQYLELRTKPERLRNSLRRIYLVGSLLKAGEVSALNAVIEAVCLTRDLVNKPLSHLNAEGLAEEVQQCGSRFGFEVEVLNKKRIEALKMGGLLSVNKGSVDPPTFTIATYRPDGAVNKKPIVLVGKGVVYDTGGYSLKPTANSMDFMKCDMAGAAVMIGTISAVAALKLPLHVVALLPATDNRVDGNAIVPGDVITMFDGTTVEVKNTDAEGRLLLGDALAYAVKYKPDLVIDAATLTGASVRATGAYASSVMGTADKRSMELLERSGDATYERLVRFPLWREHGKELQSQVADMSNLGKGEGGQMSAGKFLEHFTNYPWIHIDIAGPSWNPSADAYRTAGGTGTGVRLLVDFLQRKYLK